MRGISEEKLKQKFELLFSYQEDHELLREIIDECQELQEPWMTLDEFLSSGFKGLCWIEFPSEIVTDAYYDGLLFKHSSTSDFAHDVNYITRVMPIHKPEPPKMSKSIDRLLIESDDRMFEYIADCLATFPVSTHECYHCGYPIKYPVTARQSDIDNFRELMKTAYRIMDKYGISAHLLADIKAELVINATKKRKQEPPND